MLQIKVYQAGELVQNKQCATDKEADKFLKDLYKNRMLLFGKEGKKMLSYKNAFYRHKHQMIYPNARYPSEPYFDIKQVQDRAKRNGHMKVEIRRV